MINELVDQYQKVYQGKAWYGKNIVDSLSAIPNALLCNRLNGSYNIVELVHHMLVWREYAIYVLNHNDDYKVKDDDNFPVINECDETNWQNLLEKLRQSQEEMVRTMTNFNRSLDDPIPQKNFSNRDLLHSIIHHDIYHIGQINFMTKYLDRAPEAVSG